MKYMDLCQLSLPRYPIVTLIIGKSITDSNLSNFLLIRFLATDPMYITYNNSVAARYLT